MTHDGRRWDAMQGSEIMEQMREMERRLATQVASDIYRGAVPPSAFGIPPLTRRQLVTLRTAERWRAAREWLAGHVLRVDIHQCDCDHWE